MPLGCIIIKNSEKLPVLYVKLIILVAGLYFLFPRFFLTFFAIKSCALTDCNPHNRMSADPAFLSFLLIDL